MRSKDEDRPEQRSPRKPEHSRTTGGILQAVAEKPSIPEPTFGLSHGLKLRLQ